MRTSNLPACLAALCLALLSCSQPMYVTILSVDDDLRPTFCVSARPDCKGPELRVSSFAVARIVHTFVEDDSFTDHKNVWSIGGDRRVLDDLHYGVVPAGWTESEAAAPLEADVFYSTGGGYWFMLHRTSPVSWSFGEGGPWGCFSVREGEGRRLTRRCS
jgi:hypothetical protein